MHFDQLHKLITYQQLVTLTHVNTSCTYPHYTQYITHYFRSTTSTMPLGTTTILNGLDHPKQSTGLLCLGKGSTECLHLWKQSLDIAIVLTDETLQ